MRTLILRLGISVLGVSVLLLLLASLLVPAAPARSSSLIASAPARSSIITDTRWLELIRSGAPGPQLNRSAAALPTLNLHLTDNLFAGHASSPAPISLVVRRNNIVIVNTGATPYPDGQGYFYAVQFYPAVASAGSGIFPTLQSGDVISLTQADASFTMTVPSLTAQVEAQADRVSGFAPASEAVTTYLYSFADGSGPYTRTVAVDAGGHYQADYAGTLDVRPRDNGYVAYSAAPGQTTYLRYVAPLLRVQVGGSEMSGVAAPLSSVMITVANADGTPDFYWSRYTAVDGSFEPYAYSPSGLKLKPGDRITATSAGQTFSMTVMTLTAQIDLTNQQVRGNAPADQAVEVLRFGGPLCCVTNSFWNETPLERAIITATVTGQYTAALALARPNYGAAIVTAPDGNQTYARFAVPYLSARMGRGYWQPYQLVGQVNDPATTVTITVQGPSGYFKDVHSAFAVSDGYFSDYAAGSLTLDSGDVITVATAQGVQAALQLPDLTGQIDPVTDIVSGTAPPGARLTLVVYFYGWPVVPPVPTPTPYSVTGGGGSPSTAYTVIVTATAQGTYLVNLHGVVNLIDNSWGEVSLITPEGHTVSRVLSLSRVEGCDLRPNLIHVGGNQVDFWPLSCSQYTYGAVRLRDAAGHIKAQEALSLGPWSYFLSLDFYTGTQPIAIVPGDSVEVEWYSSPQFVPTPTPTQLPWPTPTPSRPAFRAAEDIHLVTIVVPTLTVQLDPVANTISGQAPPSTTVTLNLYRDKDQLGVFTAAVDAHGVYTVNLATDVTLEAGDTARVTYTPIELPAFSTVGVLPMMRVQLYQWNVEGFLPPLSAYTATLQTTPPLTASYHGLAANDGAFSFGLALIKPGDVVTVATAQHVLQLTAPSLTAHVDRATATVSGQAPPLARLRVVPDVYAGYYRVSQTVTATASGTYSATFPSLAPLDTAYGELTYLDAEGDQAVLSFATAYWDVIIGGPCLSGIIDVIGTPLTLTLRNDGGSVKSTLVFTPTSPYYSACFTSAVQSGDQIVMQSTLATEIFTVPVLSAWHNFALGAVEGVAPPNHELHLQAWWNISHESIERHTYSDASGRYGVDTSDLHPPLRSLARIYLRDEAGNTISAYFTVTGYQTFLPIMRR